jgi:hypothetical protein
MPNRKLFIAILLIGLLFAMSLQAKSRGTHVTQEKIGQRYYLSACGSCHGAGKMGGNMAASAEWKALLANHGKELSELHRDENSTQKIILYLNGSQFVKEHDNLLKFLQEFANDSDSIPTCY